jgi:hypothetical protein
MLKKKLCWPTSHLVFIGNKGHVVDMLQLAPSIEDYG